MKTKARRNCILVAFLTIWNIQMKKLQLLNPQHVICKKPAVHRPVHWEIGTWNKELPPRTKLSNEFQRRSNPWPLTLTISSYCKRFVDSNCVLAYSCLSLSLPLSSLETVLLLCKTQNTVQLTFVKNKKYEKLYLI